MVGARLRCCTVLVFLFLILMDLGKQTTGPCDHQFLHSGRLLRSRSAAREFFVGHSRSVVLLDFVVPLDANLRRDAKAPITMISLDDGGRLSVWRYQSQVH